MRASIAASIYIDKLYVYLQYSHSTDQLLSPMKQIYVNKLPLPLTDVANAYTILQTSITYIHTALHGGRIPQLVPYVSSYSPIFISSYLHTTTGSEQMSLVQLFVPAEVAHDTVAELGELGNVQFKDVI